MENSFEDRDLVKEEEELRKLLNAKDNNKIQEVIDLIEKLNAVNQPKYCVTASYIGTEIAN